MEDNKEVYQLLDNPNGIDDWTWFGTGKGEYFLVENRRKTGFDAALPGEGLLIWHIDESIGDNDDYLHKQVDLEEADGLEHLDNIWGFNSGDVFDPWYNRVTGFTATSTPHSHFYNGSDSGIRVTDIGASAAAMTATLVVDRNPSQPGTKIGVYEDGIWYLDWNGNGAWDAGTDKMYPFGATGWISVIGDWNPSLPGNEDRCL